MPDANQSIRYLLTFLFAALPAMALAGSLGPLYQSSHHTEPSSLGSYDAITLLPSISAASLNNEAGLSQNDNASNIHVTVNGQSVAVPKNGSVHQTVPVNGGSGGQTTVDISAQNSSSNSAGNSRSRTNVQVHTNTSSVLNIEQTDN